MSDMITPVSGNMNNVNTTNISSTSKVGGLSGEQFLKLFLQELQTQDPTAPVDNKEFMNQMATFTNLANTTKIANNTDAILNQAQSEKEVGLVGKSVMLKDDQFNTYIVESVDIGTPNLLNIRNKDGKTSTQHVTFEQIRQIKQTGE